MEPADYWYSRHHYRRMQQETQLQKEMHTRYA
jgi:hypothetical protein